MGWKDCVLDPVGCTVGNVAGEAAESTWDSFTRWVAQGLTDLAATVFDAFSASTTPDFSTDWLRDYLDTLVLVSLPILALFFVLQVITGVVRREVGYLGRALVGVAVGAMGVPLALALVDGLSSFVDAASAYLIRTHSPAGFERLFETTALVTAASGGGFVLVALFLAIFAMFALYLVLLLRQVALLAIVVFAPLALVGWTWHSTRSWLRRWAEVTAALLISKFAMAVVFSLGLSAIGRTGEQGTAATIGDLLAGVVLLAIAAFAPWACFHFLHWAGTESATAVHHATQRGTTTARQQATRAQQTMQQAVQRATATQQQGSQSQAADSGSRSLGVRRAQGPAGGGSTGAGQSGAKAAGTVSGGGAGAGGGSAAAAGGGVGAGVGAGVQATHAVAKGIKQAGEQAGTATQEHTAEASGSSQQSPEPVRGSATSERATRPTPPTRKDHR